jgi:hypothetical protein
MDLAERLEASSEELVAEATAGLDHARLAHYTKAGPETTRARVEALLSAVTQTLREGSPVAVVAHADTVARERFTAGFGIEEIQVAFNILEETLWRHLVAEAPAPELGTDLGLVGSAVGAGKDQLARSYVELASRRHVPRIDVEALQDQA